MDRFFKSIALMIIVFVGAVSCSKTDIDKTNIDTSTQGTVLYATAGDAETRVAFTENEEDNGIDLAWELDDEFILYDSEGEELGTFVCTDIEAGKFVSEGVITLISDAAYTAKYNEPEDEDDIYSQNGDEINNLNNACQMEAVFEYSEDETPTIAFSHTMAIMTFTFESAERPAYLIFENGEEAYKVTYAEIEPVNSVYTSHVMINPCDDTERTLTFSLYATAEAVEAYDIRTVTTTKAYTAGYRYTSPVSDLENIVWEGAGTESDPYQIETAAQLRQLSANVNAGTTYIYTYFEMVNDIDLGGIDESGEGIASGEFTAIGSLDERFEGTFDGGGYKVSGLYINQPSSIYQGLFGYAVYGAIKNLDVSGSIIGSKYVGGVVGYINHNATVSNCCNNATVKGSGENYYYYVGGIVGYTNANTMVINCCNTGTVSGSNHVGGIVGHNSYATVVNCYNTGAVSASNESVGGVSGYNVYSTIVNCYNTGAVSGSSYVGGISGRNYNTSSVATAPSSVIINCYSAGSVNGTSYLGGVVGSNTDGSDVCDSSVTNCYFDKSVYTGDAVGDNDGGTVTNVVGYETSFVKSSSFATVLSNNAYTYNQSNPDVMACAWKVEVSGDYPTLDVDNIPSSYSEFEDVESCTAYGSGTESDPYLIYSGSQLEDLSSDVSGGTNYSGEYFEVMWDIDLGGESNEFAAIGVYGETSFEGNFDGGGYSITGLCVSGSSTGQGLFGDIKNNTIKNLKVGGSVSNTSYHTALIAGCATNVTFISCSTLEGSTVSCTGTSGNNNTAGIAGFVEGASFEDCHNNASVSGVKYVAGVVGYCYVQPASFTNCSNSGIINSSNTFAGGVVAYLNNSSTVANCYNTGSVTASVNNAGGVVSYLGSSSTVTSCYSSGTVSGSSSVGGIAGENSASTITNCYFNSDVYNGYAVGTDSGTVTNVVGYSTSYMQGVDFIILLDSGAYTYNNSYPEPAVKAYAWQAVSGGYPAFDAERTPVDLVNVSSCTAYGSGTESDPYLIYSGLQLRDLSSDVSGGTNYSGKYFEMMWDIDLGGEDNEFTAIGNSSGSNYKFKGTFDGGGYEVSGLYINASSSYQGLFGYIDSATIKNLGVSGSVTVTSTSKVYYASGVVGYTYSSTVSNCYNKATVEGVYDAGGIVGSASTNSTITDCYNAGTISASINDAGGIAGTASSSTISNCYNTGSVTGSVNNTGGVVAYANGVTVSSCYNTGDVNGIGERTGGVVGYAYTSSMVTDCYNEGSVSGTKYVGGVVGCSLLSGASSTTTTSVVTNCYSVGEVSGTNYVGGVSGYAYSLSTVTNCYSMGSVSGYSCVGGVLGYAYSSTYNSPTVTNCYSAGKVSGTSCVGGVLGYAFIYYDYYPYTSLINCYYDSDVYSDGSALGDSTDVIITDVSGKSTSDMTGGSFAATLGEAFMEDYTTPVNSKYPILTWQ